MMHKVFKRKIQKLFNTQWEQIGAATSITKSKTIVKTNKRQVEYYRHAKSKDSSVEFEIREYDENDEVIKTVKMYVTNKKTG